MEKLSRPEALGKAEAHRGSQQLSKQLGGVSSNEKEQPVNGLVVKY